MEGSHVGASLAAAVSAREPDLIALRRDLHAHPELSRQETRTTEVVVDVLTRAGLRVRPLVGTGLVADLGPEDATHRVALRADLDALPVHERSGLTYASTIDGVCHACGHDVHVSSLVGAGLVLQGLEDLLVDRRTAVRLIFQPAEEVIPGGALDVIAQGALEGVDVVLGLHCDPSLEVGLVGLREGPITSAADAVTVTLAGRGGHTSRPHLTEDLTYALGKVITDVPAVLARRVDPRAGLALVWGSVHSGVAANVIPSSGTVVGTMRMLDEKAWAGIGAVLEEVVHGVVAPYAVTAKVEHIQGVPPVVNTADALDLLRQSAVALGGPSTVTGTIQSLGGEDFSWYLQQLPGAMARLGTRSPGGAAYDLHQGDLVVDERAIGLGARLLAGAALVSGPGLVLL